MADFPRRVRTGLFEIDLGKARVSRNGREVPIQEQPFRVLAMLIDRPGELVLRENIQAHLWPTDTYVSFEEGLNTAVRKLRVVFRDSADNPRFIQTVPRKGYRFIAPVKELIEDPRLIDLGELSKIEVDPGESAAASQMRRRCRSLAVLPFANGTGPPEAEYMSEGISASIINLLSQFSDLRVVPRTSSFRYKGREADLKRVSRELNVDVVLTGTVVQRGERLIVQTELVDVANDAQLWGDQYNRKLEDIFVLQEELARRISQSLRPRLTPKEDQFLTRRPTENREAYPLFLKAMYYANKWSPDGVRKGIEYSRQAIDADPLFARAYAGLAYLYMLVSSFGSIPPLQAFPLARAAATRALDIDDTLAVAHACLAYVKLAYDWDWTGAEIESRRAIELAPNIPEGHHVLSQWCLVNGRSEEAIAEARRAMELDPLSLPEHGNLALTYHKLGEYNSAIEQLQKALALDPSFTPARKLLALSYAHAGKCREAFAELEKVPVSPGGATRTDTSSKGIQGVIYALCGRRAEARSVLDELEGYSQSPHFVSALDCAYIHSCLGDTGKALDYFDRALQGRAPTLFYIATPDHPIAQILRKDPRFGGLLRRIGIHE